MISFPGRSVRLRTVPVALVGLYVFLLAGLSPAVSLGVEPDSPRGIPSASGPAIDGGEYLAFGIGAVVVILALGGGYLAARAAVVQKTAELAASEARLADVQRIGRIGHWTLDLASERFECSDELYRIYGIAVGSPLSLGAITEAIHEDDAAEADRTRAAAIAEKRGYAFAFRIRRPDGEVRHVEGRSDVIVDASGMVTGFFGITQDASERVQALQALSLTQVTVDSAADAVFWLDESGRLEYVNRAGERMLGYSRAALSGMYIWEIDPDVPEAGWPQVWQKVLDRGDYSFEARHRTKDGRFLPVEVTTTGISYSGRTLVCSFSRDITERKRAEKALRESEAQHRLVIDSLPVLICYHDADRHYVMVNKTTLEWYDKTLEEVVGKLPEEVFGGQYVKWQSRMREALRGETVTEERTVLYPDGVTRDVRAVYVPNVNADGKVVGVFSLVEDLTRIKQVQEQLRRSQKMEAIGQITGGVAHEFNNLLMAITGNLELLIESGFQDAAAVRSQIERILTFAFKGKDLTGHLLSYMGNPFDRPETVDVGEAVLRSAAFLRPVLGETLSIECDVAQGLWPIWVDPGEFQNALTNLVVNARDAMPDGGVITMVVRNAPLDETFSEGRPYMVVPGDYVSVSVTDRGTGMPPEVVERVFDPFFTTKEVGKGTGLGLSMVYGFAHRQSAGYVDVRSQEGEGTSVTMYFPRAVAHAAAHPAETRRSAGAMPHQTVLLVEDDQGVRDMLARRLEGLNFNVICAADGVAATEALEADRKIDLLLTDIILPRGVSGIDLSERVRREQPETKIVLISGYAKQELVAKGIPADRYPLLSKPFRKADLLQILDEVFASG